MAKVTRFKLENYCHFVTSKTYRNAKIFSKGEATDLLIQTIFEVKKKLNFRLLAFVVMPDHIHLMLVPDKRNSISDVMRHIKGRFSRRYNLLSRGMNSPDYGVQDHRAGNSSPSHKPNTHRAGNSSPSHKPNTHRAGNLSLPKSKVWQDSFYDHIIRNRKEFVQRLNYIHYNPVRAGLVEKAEDYKYSSATGKFNIDLNTCVGG
ncbi:MAG: transposase [Candidatus Zixiibacteriota bacterium]